MFIFMFLIIIIIFVFGVKITWSGPVTWPRCLRALAPPCWAPCLVFLFTACFFISVSHMTLFDIGHVIVTWLVPLFLGLSDVTRIAGWPLRHAVCVLPGGRHCHVVCPAFFAGFFFAGFLTWHGLQLISWLSGPMTCALLVGWSWQIRPMIGCWLELMVRFGHIWHVTTSYPMTFFSPVSS